jgi:hypothetical protein
MTHLSNFTLLLILMAGLGACSNAREFSAPQNAVEGAILELTSFQLVPGTDEAQFLAAARQMQESFLSKQEGFMHRTLVKGEQNWTDIIYWKDAQSMDMAMQKAETSSALPSFMQMIDMQSVSLNQTAIKMNISTP